MLAGINPVAVEALEIVNEAITNDSVGNTIVVNRIGVHGVVAKEGGADGFGVAFFNINTISGDRDVDDAVAKVGRASAEEEWSPAFTEIDEVEVDGGIESGNSSGVDGGICAPGGISDNEVSKRGCRGGFFKGDTSPSLSIATIERNFRSG